MSFFLGGGGFFPGAICLGIVLIPSSKIVINLHRTYEKLLCKGEPYPFSGQRDPSVNTDIYRFFYFIIRNLNLIFQSEPGTESSDDATQNPPAAISSLIKNTQISITSLVPPPPLLHQVKIKRQLWYFHTQFMLSTKYPPYS